MSEKTLRITPSLSDDDPPFRIFVYEDGMVLTDRLPLTSPIPRSAQVVSAYQYPHATIEIEHH